MSFAGCVLDLAYELSPALRSFLHVHRSSSYSVRDGGASSAFSSLALACNKSSSSYSPCVEGSTPPPPPRREQKAKMYEKSPYHHLWKTYLWPCKKDLRGGA